MMRKLGLVTALVAAMLLLLVTAACSSKKSYRAERFDVDIVVHENGSATITETVTFAFQGGPFTYAYRDIPLDRTDSISGFALSEGERVYAPGSGENQFEVRRDGDSQRVTWRFSPTENAARTFVLTYQVAGLIRQEGAQDALRWTALPPKHDYGITQSQVLVRLPENVGPLAGAQVLEGHAQPGILGRQVTFQANQVERNQGLAIGIWFPHGQVQGVPPAWQRTQLEQARWAPLWGGLAGLVAILALVGCIVVWRRWGHEPVAVTQSILMAPPSDLPVGLAGALVHNGARLPDMLATLLDLGRRGAFAVEETEPSGARQRKPGYAIRLLALPADLRPFEVWTLYAAALKAATGRTQLSKAERAAGATADRTVLEGLAAAGTRIPLAEVSAGLRNNCSALQRVYDGELYALGLFDHKRDRLRRIPIIAGVALFALAVASIAAFAFWARFFGAWPALLTLALLGSGLAMLLVGLACARRSAEGEQAATDWHAFRRHLQQLARGRAHADQVGLFERYLPNAVAFGLEHRWARQMAAIGAPLPAWFRSLGQEASAQFSSFIVMIAAISAASHGGAGGAGAAGAAGGGASGAG